jgi:hypothetical protein
MRGPIENASERYAALVAKFEAARKRRQADHAS